MLARVTAFFVWLLVGAAAVLWGLRLSARPLPLPDHAATASNDVLPIGGDVARLLRAPPEAAETPVAAAPALASRIRLVGVMAPPAGRPGDAGLAMLVIDGKPARAFRPGASVEGDLVLQSVGLRTAAIGPVRGAPVVTLEVPRLPAAATGTLPAAGAAPGQAAPASVPPPPGGPAGLPATRPSVLPNAGLPPPVEAEDPQSLPPVQPPQAPPTQRQRSAQ